MKHSPGITVFEITAALAVFAPVLLAFSVMLSGAAKSAMKTKAVTESETAFIKLRSLCSTTLEDLDSHRLQIMPRIHRNGQIHFTDDSPNPVMRAVQSRRPANDSDALTGIRLSISAAQRVIQTAPSSENILITACSRLGGHFSPATYRSYVGLGVDGMLEMTGDALPHAGRPDCHDFTLRSTPSMSLPYQPQQTESDVRLLIPIESHYTWFVDNSRRLRFLSHAGSENIENQPVMDRVGRLQFSSELTPANLFFLGATYEAAGGVPLEFTVNSHLSRKAPWSLLMNLS